MKHVPGANSVWGYTFSSIFDNQYYYLILETYTVSVPISLYKSHIHIMVSFSRTVTTTVVLLVYSGNKRL